MREMADIEKEMGLLREKEMRVLREGDRGGDIERERERERER